MTIRALNIKRMRIFDGMDDELRLFVHKPGAGGEKVEIPLKKLVSFSKLEKSIDKSTLENIANKIGTIIRYFGGNPIFQGCEKGLRLYGFQQLAEDNHNLYVYSLGEVQPARFICFYEGTFQITPSY